MAAPLCEMTEEMQNAFHEEDSYAAAVYAGSAYQQFLLSDEGLIWRCSIIKVHDGLRVEDVLVIYLIGVFGDARAGHVYNISGMAIDYKNNLSQSIRRSQTYIDDGILMSSQRLISPSAGPRIVPSTVLTV